MASMDGRRRTERRALASVVPIRHGVPDDPARADDELVERVRAGRSCNLADPLVRMLVAWRAEVNRLR